jgi:hypothetical protein
MSGAFVVGTGRCGSTMLSNMLREHAGVLSLSEVFSLVTDLGGRIAQSFPEEPVDGERFWGVVGGVHPRQTTLFRHDIVMDEVLYRPNRNGVPALLQTALPHLTQQPEQLLAEVRAFVTGLPPAQPGEQYRRLFDWLAQRLGKRGWVERSGGSLRVVARLMRAFPDARFVHLVRDGRDCALSMSQHPGFRMALICAQLTEILGVDPYESRDRSREADLPDDLFPFLPEHFDARAFLSYQTPPALCGHYWSGEILAGLAELEDLERGRLLVLRYEDFLAEPRAPLARLMDFLGEDCHEDWLERVAGSVRAPRCRWRELPPSERRELELACRPGLVALGALYG